MKRKISTKRLYVLGRFKNIELTDIIEDIPVDLAMDSAFMTNLRMLQLISLDKVYLSYVQKSITMREVDFLTNKESIEEYLETLDTARVSTLENLKVAIASVEEKQSRNDSEVKE